VTLASPFLPCLVDRPISGVEAVISYQLVKKFQIPCAHAPAMSPLPLSLFPGPKSAAEEVGKL